MSSEPRPTPRFQGRVRLLLVLAGAILALVAGVWALHRVSSRGPVTDNAPAAPRHAPLPRSPATGISIPALALEAPVTRLGLDTEGRIATPSVDEPRLAGWYEYGPAPGEMGTAVVVGHRDTRTGPAVFLNLDDLRPGDVIDVLREDQRTAVFTVDAVRTIGKHAFPDDRVYGPRGRPELRLLTCGGTFDQRRGYAANIVVFSHLTGVKQTSARA
ncbi:class F sortase [Streptomyces sp. XD-27]|uniref:class F sortase n=1 Tax=Streptomyces sp. XD-27 TaxID=3062779 RepID=UPI0026F43E1E|nr:class F sortase [Streptomyces sp. XD-27]WKX69553.1 class F sortase [Streptomyces sp. XD-27]